MKSTPEISRAGLAAQRVNGHGRHQLSTAGEIPTIVDALLSEAIACRASDIHVEPTHDGYELRYRVDGMVQRVHAWDSDTGRAIVGRLMVMAGLLTYRQDIPQEGRATIAYAGAEGLAVRVSVIPTVQGLRAAVRLPAELIQPTALDELGLPDVVLQGLKKFASAESGMLLVTGPAGSGKTTTIYALLRHIAEVSPGVSIITLEDPVERALPGVTQIQIQPFGELTYERCLRSILRQDPQVLMLGEIRDAQTATLAIQAALSGHRLISTLHGSSAAGAIARLSEMGVEPYQITSALWGVLAQRLLRRINTTPLESGTSLTPSPGTPGEGRVRALSDKRDDSALQAMPSPRSSPGVPGEEGRQEARAPIDQPARTYRGRAPVAELAAMDRDLAARVLSRSDAAGLHQAISSQAGFKSLTDVARDLIQQQITDEHEARRVLGGAFGGGNQP